MGIFVSFVLLFLLAEALLTLVQVLLQKKQMKPWVHILLAVAKALVAVAFAACVLAGPVQLRKLQPFMMAAYVALLADAGVDLVYTVIAAIAKRERRFALVKTLSLICGVLFMLVLVAVAGTSVFIMSLGQELAIVLNQIFKGFASAFRNGEGLDVVLLIIEVSLCALFYLLRTILHVYCACSIGQRMKSKIGGAIMWFFILYGIQQGTGTVLELVFLPILFNDSFSTVTMHIMLSGYAFYQFAIALTFYLISRYRIKNRLNLE